MVKYEFKAQGLYWAVIRTGPRGGTRTVAVYASQAAASAVTLVLQQNSKREA